MSNVIKDGNVFKKVKPINPTDIKKKEYKTLKSKGKPKNLADIIERLEKLEEILGLDK